MKFFRYKQVARLTFMGIDDEYNNVASSYYTTKLKLLIIIIYLSKTKII